MEKIHVIIDWCEKNYSAMIGDNIDGVVIVTDKSLDKLKKKLDEALAFHFEGIGEEAAKWMKAGDYQLEYEYTFSATLQRALQYTTLTALSLVTGIHHAQLSRYANAITKPKKEQQERVMNGIHQIGNACMTIS